MYGGFFGSFLQKEGVISSEELSSAIAAQRQARQLLGDLAKDRKWINDAALQEILSRQVEQQRKFGEVAVDGGWLTTDQVDTLLTEQSRNHLLLGEALVKTGLLDTDRLNHYLRLYRRENDEATAAMAAQIDGLQDKNLINLVLTTYRSYLFRTGYAVKVAAVKHKLSDMSSPTVPFLGSYRMGHGKTVLIGPILPEKTLFLLAAGASARGSSGQEAKRDAIEYLEQVFYSLNYHNCRESRHGAGNAHIGAIRTSLPRSAVISFEMVGLIEPFSIAYFA